MNFISIVNQFYLFYLFRYQLISSLYFAVFRLLRRHFGHRCYSKSMANNFGTMYDHPILCITHVLYQLGAWTRTYCSTEYVFFSVYFYVSFEVTGRIAKNFMLNTIHPKHRSQSSFFPCKCNTSGIGHGACFQCIKNARTGISRISRSQHIMLVCFHLFITMVCLLVGYCLPIVHHYRHLQHDITVQL